MFEIDSHIPIPPRRTRTSSYPFANMAVGDSFFVGTKDEADDKRAFARLSAATQLFRKRDPSYADYRFVIRAVTEGDKVGIRVWRRA